MNEKDKKFKSSRPEQGSEASPERDEKDLPELLVKLSKLGVPMAPDEPPSAAPRLRLKEAQSWREFWEATGRKLPDWVDGEPLPRPPCDLLTSPVEYFLWVEVTPKKFVEAYRREQEYWADF